MSISAVGGVSPLAFQSIASTGKPESAEVAGAPDHDGDSDDRAGAVAQTGTPAGLGSVNLFA
jgi:hypothetical protein